MEAATRGAPGALPYQEEMEAAFEQDFGRVRAFLGRTAPMAELGASAAARGEDIAFATDAPSRHLVAHELTHVVQARQAPLAATTQLQSEVAHDEEAAESEAEDVASRVLEGERVTVREAPSAAVHMSRGPASADSASQGLAAGRSATLAALLAGHYHKADHHPSTGGRFGVDYSPGAGILRISLKLHFQFGAGTGMTPRPPGGGRRPEFDWTDAEKANWTTSTVQAMERAWSGKHVFQCLKPGWHRLPPVRVQLDVQVVDEASQAHKVVGVHKAPKPGDRDDETNWIEDSTDGSDTPKVMRYELVESDALERLNPQVVHFEPGSFALRPADFIRLKMFGNQVARNKGRGLRLSVRGAAAGSNTAERDPEALASLRAQAVRNALALGGYLEPIELGHLVYEAHSPTLMHAGITINGGTSAQTTPNHEVGHLLGLGDEYVDHKRNQFEGAEAHHSKLARKLGMGDVTIRTDQRIMSAGEFVEPYHYATFLEALRSVTKVQEWGTR